MTMMRKGIQMVTYEAIRETIQTGDVVLFRGKGRISRWIRWWCSLVTGLRPTWASHVGVAVREGRRLLLLESTSIRGGVKGVRLTPLSDALAAYDGQVRLRRLSMIQTMERRAAIRRFVGGMLGRPYEQNLLELIRSAWTATRNTTAAMDSVFCSELVAALYQHMDLLPELPPANNYTPEDFRKGGAVDQAMAALGVNAALGMEVDLDTKGIEP
jgi:hypothetical protein